MPNDIQTEPLGLRLKQAREAQGLRIDDVSGQIRLPRRVIEAIEACDWDRLGSGVHLRGQLMSYARLVDVPRSEVDAHFPARQPVEPLVTMAHTSRLKHTLDRSARKFVYVAITAVLALPVWLGTREHLSGRDSALTSLDQPLDVGMESAAPVPPDVGLDTPVLASLTPAYQREPVQLQGPVVPPATGGMTPEQDAAESAAADAGAGLVLRAHGESWFEVYGHEGQRLAQGLLQDGEVRQFDAGAPARVTLGNAEAVDVLNAGEAIDLAPYQRAQVARFTISRDGSLTPPGG
ncbi:RodZ domain-containing protein [Coralloluteibacterium stylophorae]|uniref:DUF4115 domain-containing protein n=1 Tax=Coralloluteibacterium stylophorae TaxID=1776034 RepID=A0A8J7VTM3_9GAMM|nr:RodZ domain-containing protein [Coralloluteibacterium stylophorae]MBS7455967.1 DUF4115 domain-containing protein [Coralloluteibacterium stylophorae]